MKRATPTIRFSTNSDEDGSPGEPSPAPRGGAVALRHDTVNDTLNGTLDDILNDSLNDAFGDALRPSRSDPRRACFVHDMGRRVFLPSVDVFTDR